MVEEYRYSGELNTLPKQLTTSYTMTCNHQSCKHASKTYIDQYVHSEVLFQ